MQKENPFDKEPDTPKDEQSQKRKVLINRIGPVVVMTSVDRKKEIVEKELEILSEDHIGEKSGNQEISER